MGEGLNRWAGLGNLAADPELRTSAAGQAILRLRLACSESYVDKSNTRQERTEFVSITVFGKRGEGLAKILSKGTCIYVEGALRTSSYEKDGEKRYRTEIVASNVLLTGRGRDGGGEAAPPRSGGFGGGGGGRGAPPREPAAPKPPQDDYGDYGGDDDNGLPF